MITGDNADGDRRDTEEHIKVCPSYEDLRVGRDLSEDVDLVAYFTEVIERRRSRNNT